MKKTLIQGTGICGAELTLSLGDMLEAYQMVTKLEEVIENHKKCEKYSKTSYDKRESIFPEGQPARIEVKDEDIEKLRILLYKMSYATQDSTIFKLEDESAPDIKNI